MIDCHFHLWTEDNSTPEKRAERAEQVGAQAEALGVERISLIGERGENVEECEEHNRTVGTYVEEYPDLFYGWARANPLWGEEGVREFRRAVEEDGLVGLKLYAQAFLDDPEVEPLAEAAVDMDVPILSHVSQRVERIDRKPKESFSENVVGLAETFPKLKLLSAHIGGGGHWEHRIKNVQEYENVSLDTSGSVCDAGQLEMAAEYLGTDRLVFGTDTWFLPGVGKLEGADLTPREKAEIAYNFEDLVPDSVPNKLTETEREAGVERAREHFQRRARPREEPIVDANAYVGNFPWRPVEAEPDELLAKMDEKGVDRAVVSSLDAVFYRDGHRGNRELAAEIDGEDRLVPFATIDPSFPGWEADLRECIEELGMQGVRLFPLYHDYAIDNPAVERLLDLCADLDVPVMFVATLEDQRQRHPNWKLRDLDEVGSKHWSGSHVDQLVEVLKACPETDVIVANAWTGAARLVEETTTSSPRGVRLDNRVREGETLVVVDDCYVFFRHQAEQLAEEVGTEHLVTGPRMPLLSFESHYIYTEQLPVEGAEKERVTSGNVLSLIEE